MDEPRGERVGRGLEMVGVGVLSLGSRSAGKIVLTRGQDPGPL